VGGDNLCWTIMGCVHGVVSMFLFSFPLDEFGAISGLGFVVAYFLLPLVKMWSGSLLGFPLNLVDRHESSSAQLLLLECSL